MRSLALALAVGTLAFVPAAQALDYSVSTPEGQLWERQAPLEPGHGTLQLRALLRSIGNPNFADGTPHGMAHVHLAEELDRVKISVKLWMANPAGFLMERAVIIPCIHPGDNPSREVVLTEHVLLNRQTLFASGGLTISVDLLRQVREGTEALDLVFSNAAGQELRGRLEFIQ